MTPELTVALISGGVALLLALLAVWGQSRARRAEAELARVRAAEERELAAARSFEPLIRAAYDLQSRLYNILQRNLLGRFFDRGDEQERSYVVESTVYVLAQYFAWTEILRGAIQRVDLAQDERTRQLTLLQDRIYSAFQTDGFARPLRVFAFEARAIGERLIRDGSRGLECLGYAPFLNSEETRMDPLIEALREDVRSLSGHLQEARPRLASLQNAVVDLLEFLDPEHIRNPPEHLSKVPANGF
jgi:hypothetical protein